MNTVDLAHVRKTFSMPFNPELAARFADALPTRQAWYRNPTREKTHIGLDVAGIRGVGTGHRGDINDARNEGTRLVAAQENVLV